MKAFIFRITQVCDKKCPTCCCGKAGGILDPDRYHRKLLDIEAYCRKENVAPVVHFTGGETFFYRARNKNGKRFDIVDLVDLTAIALPNVSVAIKTSGWAPHRILDRLLRRVESPRRNVDMDVRFGFNLFQKNGADASQRLHHMIDSILSYQDAMRIETIYDRENFSRTLDLIADGLARFGFQHGKQLKEAFTRPESYYRVKIPVHPENRTEADGPRIEKTVILDTMPAYEGFENSTSDRFYSADWGAICPAIDCGPDHILYNSDLSFYQCNDAFTDYSIPPYDSAQFDSVSAEFEFLEKKFSRLKTNIANKKQTFRTKRQQCLYCSDFMHSDC